MKNLLQIMICKTTEVCSACGGSGVDGQDDDGNAYQCFDCGGRGRINTTGEEG